MKSLSAIKGKDGWVVTIYKKYKFKNKKDVLSAIKLLKLKKSIDNKKCGYVYASCG